MIKLVSDLTFLFEEKDIKYLSVDQFINEIHKMKGTLGIDTETEGFNPFHKKLLTLQIGNFDTQYVIDMRTTSEKLIKVLKEFFRSEDRIFLFHNAKFDLKFLFMKGILPNKVYDSFLVESIIYQGIYWEKHPKSLYDLALKYVGVHLDKSIRGDIHWKGLTYDVIKYAADDVKYLPLIREKQMEQIDKEKLWHTVSLENEFVKVLSYIELSGLKLDVPRWKQRIEEDKRKLVEIELQLDSMVIANPQFSEFVDNQLSLFSDDLTCRINWSSPTQCVKFFKKIGCDLKTKDKKTGMMKDSVDAKVLIPQKHLHPIIETYLEYKTLDKMIGTYGDNWLEQIDAKTGRIHTQFKQLLDTARLSSGGKNKKTKEEYINFLNIPQDNRIRNCIIPEKGKVFIDCDYSGQESIVLANRSKEPKLIEFYNQNGGDLHSFVASKIYPECAEVPLDEIKVKFKKQRQEAKSANFAIAYGGVGATIANNLSISIEEGDKVYDAYLNAFPQLKLYFERQKKITLMKGYILTDNITGRKIYLDDFEEFKELEKQLTPEFWEQYREEKAKNSPLFINELKPIVRKYFMQKGNYERMSLNYPIQSQSASITKLACIYVYREIEKQNAFWEVLFPNVIHDQIILEVPEDKANEWADIVQTSMERAGDIFCRTVKLKAEPEILTEWKK